MTTKPKIVQAKVNADEIDDGEWVPIEDASVDSLPNDDLMIEHAEQNDNVIGRPDDLPAAVDRLVGAMRDVILNRDSAPTPADLMRMSQSLRWVAAESIKTADLLMP